MVGHEISRDNLDVLAENTVRESIIGKVMKVTEYFIDLVAK